MKYLLEEEAHDQFETVNGAQYCIFGDDENGIRIEIFPDSLFQKEDVWQLVDQLLYSIGEIDENGDLIEDKEDDLVSPEELISADGLYKIVNLAEYSNPEKKLLVITNHSNVSATASDTIKTNAEKTLKSANIAAEVLVLSEGSHAHWL